MNNPVERPHFEVIDTDTKKVTNVDLNEEPVKE